MKQPMLLALLAIWPSIFVAGALAGPHANVVSLCAISKNPQLYDGNLVRAKIKLVTNCMEQTALIDDDCRASGGFGLGKFDSRAKISDILGYHRAYLAYCHKDLQHTSFAATVLGIVDISSRRIKPISFKNIEFRRQASYRPIFPIKPHKQQ